ncbi:MAG: hypothetical protein R3F14_03235 [Polyangiaceae bacterium]
MGPKVTEQEILAFNLLAGFHIEQFLTRRMSLVAGVAAPLFAFSSIQTSDEPTSTTISSDLSTTRLYGLFVLYTD